MCTRGREPGTDPVLPSVGPPVGDGDAVAALGAVGSDRDQLEAVGAALETADRLRRDPHDVPLRELDDVVARPHTAGAGDDDVDLLLLAVVVADRRPEPRRIAGVAAGGVFGGEMRAGGVVVGVGDATAGG